MSGQEALPFLFFLIALAYSSVGFAGGSSYLLVLTLLGVAHSQSVPVALVCNLIVSSIGVWNFYRAGHLRFGLVTPFLALSIPLAFLGSKISISKEIFVFLLGSALVLAALRLFIGKIENGNKIERSSAALWRVGLPSGAIMGFFSGLIGIGGGIFLSPFLILSRLAGVKEASAAACFFIWANSLSGLVGKIQQGFVLPESIGLLGLAAFCGGWIGSQLASSRRFPEAAMCRTLAVLMFCIAGSLLWKTFA